MLVKTRRKKALGARKMGYVEGEQKGRFGGWEGHPGEQGAQRQMGPGDTAARPLRESFHSQDEADRTPHESNILKGDKHIWEKVGVNVVINT